MRMTAKVRAVDLGVVLAALVKEGVNFEVRYVDSDEMYLVTFNGGF